MGLLKIVIAGPKSSGKSTIGNFLSGHKETLASHEKYNPTSGVRILELENKIGAEVVNVELWDASGDHS